MTDLVERLRRDLMEISYDDIEAMVREAADEIERLGANQKELLDAIQKARQFLDKLVPGVGWPLPRRSDSCPQTARATLEPKP